MVRRTKEEMRAEFDRLSDIFELYCEFERSKMSKERAENHRSLVTSREEMISWVEQGKATMSDIVAGTREAINDTNEMLSYSVEDRTSYASEFFAFYRERTGRDYYDDAGHPKKMARKILKRGEILDETEYRLIDGVLSNVEQTVFKDNEIARVNEMLSRFASNVGDT